MFAEKRSDGCLSSSVEIRVEIGSVQLNRRNVVPADCDASEDLVCGYTNVVVTERWFGSVEWNAVGLEIALESGVSEMMMNGVH